VSHVSYLVGVQCEKCASKNQWWLTLALARKLTFGPRPFQWRVPTAVEIHSSVIIYTQCWMLKLAGVAQLPSLVLIECSS
jgi:hypothetical protein